MGLSLGSPLRSASAQQLVDRSVSTQLFQPFIGPVPFLALERAAFFSHLHYGAGIYINYQRKPFEIATNASGTSDDPTRIVLVSDQLTSDLVGGLGFGFGWFQGQVALALPVHLLTSGNEIDNLGAEGEAFGASGIGDIRLQLKVKLFGTEKLLLAMATTLSLPTGCASAGGGFGDEACNREGTFGGDAGVTFSPQVIADLRLGAFTIGANLGWLFREKTEVLSTEIDDRLLYGVGLAWDTGWWVTAMVELVGQVGFTRSDGCRGYANHSQVCVDPDRDNLEVYPLEVLAAGDLRLRHGLSVVLGVGVGLVRAIGTPEVRVLGGMRWIPSLADRDKDGIIDAEDKCPTQAEDRDGFEDSDGCPEVDNDGDLIPDLRDKCPDIKEDMDSFRDHDGCPEVDNDGDMIPDTHDHCPFKPETRNGFKDKDGCPDKPDHDGDGLEDTADLCPRKPETFNGFKDADGCPDAEKGNLEIRGAEIILRKPLSFAGNRIHRRSRSTLDQLAALLMTRPLAILRIVAVPKKARDMRRWQKRAEAVQSFLKKTGVLVERLKIEVTDLSIPGARTTGELIRGGILFFLPPRAKRP